MIEIKLAECLNKHNSLTTGPLGTIKGCGSQRRQCSCYSTKTHVNSMILILKLNLTSLRNIYMKSGLRWAAHTFYCICLSTKSNAISGLGSRYLYEFSLSNNYMSSLRTATCDALIVPSGDAQNTVICLSVVQHLSLLLVNNWIKPKLLFFQYRLRVGFSLLSD